VGLRRPDGLRAGAAGRVAKLQPPVGHDVGRREVGRAELEGETDGDWVAEGVVQHRNTGRASAGAVELVGRGVVANLRMRAGIDEVEAGG
ncbi:hypothetical protein ABTL32_19355, partial [Acinetobacter baumannii]